MIFGVVRSLKLLGAFKDYDLRRSGRPISAVLIALLPLVNNLP